MKLSLIAQVGAALIVEFDEEKMMMKKGQQNVDDDAYGDIGAYLIAKQRQDQL
jgi:hypothetical protein